MLPVDRRLVRFVRDLLAGGEVSARGRDKTAHLDPGDLQALVSAGVVRIEADVCIATGEARGWLKRRLLENDAYAAQHRLEVERPDGTRVNVAESPLARLAHSANGEPPFLQTHHVEAGERVRRLAERAQLQARVTMSYSAAHTAGGVGRAHDMGDMAADARKALGEISRMLPHDCAGVVLDVCGLLKGLQVVETERGWPRRSAKLVLRIGLEQLAQHYGLAPMAVGTTSGRHRSWLGEGARPERFE